MDRRRFLVVGGSAVVGVAALDLGGCAALHIGAPGQSVADEIIAILQDLEPAVEGVLPIVALVNPALGPAVQAGITLFDNGVTAVSKAYNDYEAALSANGATAPTLKQDVLAALAVLSNDAGQLLAAARVTDPAHEQLIQDLITAVTQEITQVVNMLNPPAAATAANVQPRGVTPVTVTRQPAAKQLKAERAAFHARIKAICSRSTGDAALDAAIAKLAKKY